MIPPTDPWAIPWLALLADWSIRWGIVLSALALWLVIRPPRRAATRHLLCLSALVAGVLLPVAPRWGNAALPWPSRWARGVGHPTAASIPSDEAATSSDGAAPTAKAIGRLTQFGGRAEPSGAPTPEIPIPTTTPSRDAWQIALLAVAGAWGVVVLAMLARLACGRMALASLRRGAARIEDAADGLIGECRDDLGLTRDVGLAVHPGVASPVVLGGLRPLVLVPSDWDAWPEPHRRACLRHELAHLARYDDWARFAQELIRAPFFFHPLVQWLLARLDREREILCDEAAVSLGSDPVDYARLLLAMARRPGRLLPVSPSSDSGLLPFLDRRTVAVRIGRLLEDDMRGPLFPPSARRPLVASAGLALAVTAALAVGGLRIRAGSAEPAPPAKPADAKRPAAPGVVRAEELREIRGTVVDPDGKPVAGATVVAGPDEPGKTGHQLLTTDAEGRFTWSVPKGTHYAGFIAHKDGLASSGWSSWIHPKNFQDFKLPLATPETFAATLVDGDGKPVAGAKVRVESIAHGSEQKTSETSSRVSVWFTPFPDRVLTGSPIEGRFTAKTDGEGRFAFGVFPKGVGLKLAVTSRDGRQMRNRPDDLSGGVSIRRNMHSRGYVTAPPGTVTRLVAVPAARVSGRVVSKVPGVGVSGLRVAYQHSEPDSRPTDSFNAGGNALADAEGRFAFDGLNEGAINVFVHGEGENKTWTYRAAKDVPLSPGVTTEATIELIRGVDVLGTVVLQGTQTPVADAEVGVYGPFRPRTGAMTTGVRTDARGRYRYRLPAGETDFYVMGPPGGIGYFPDKKSGRTVTIPDDVARFQVPEIEVAPAVRYHGKVLDVAGAPIAGARVAGVYVRENYRPFSGFEVITDARGEFRLPPGLSVKFAIGTTASLLIQLRDGSEHRIAATPAADGSVEIRLPR